MSGKLKVTPVRVGRRVADVAVDLVQEIMQDRAIKDSQLAGKQARSLEALRRRANPVPPTVPEPGRHD